jgi:archaellum component FlaF (FlaF/FlaG flagellin family)
MYLICRRLGGKAVSQVVGALLIIAVTVAAAILLYVFAVGLVGNLASGAGQQVVHQMVLGAYSFPIDGPLSITVRNVGSTSVDLSKADFFINGISATPGAGCAVTLAIGDSCTTTLNLSAGYGSLVKGISYPLKIVTPDGAVFAYSVIYGSNG